MGKKSQLSGGKVTAMRAAPLADTEWSGSRAMRRDVVFVHIPKSAGTSMRTLLEDFGQRNHIVLRDYAEAPVTTPALSKLVYQDNKLGEFRRHFNRPAKGILLSGHFPAERYWDYFNAESFVTLLRHPVDRCISEYVHYVNHKGWKGTLREFAGREGVCNVLSRFLKHVDLDEFGFIGFSENFEATLPALGEYLGVELPMRRANVGNYTTVEQELRDAKKMRAMFADLNAEDMELYERMQKQRWDAPQAPGAAPELEKHYIGRVNLRDSGIAAGYVFNSQREFITHVEISSEGQSLAVVAADQYRDGTQAKGSRTGVCGFRVNLAEILSGKLKSSAMRLTFRARNSDYELAGSPVEFSPQQHAPSDANKKPPARGASAAGGAEHRRKS